MRQIVKAKDIVLYFGKSIHTSYKILQKIRIDLEKSNSHPITIQEFDNYFKFEINGIGKAVMENDAIEKAEKSLENQTLLAKKKEEVIIANTSAIPYQFSKNHNPSNFK